MIVYCPFCDEEHEVKGNPWDELGSSDICPKKSILEYDERYDEESGDTWETWYFRKTGTPC